MSPIHPLVYFIRIGKFIKIGFTTDLEQRLAAFRGASAEPMEVLVKPYASKYTTECRRHPQARTG